MNKKEIFSDLQYDLQSINSSANERLLKEEQVRSTIFSSLKKQGYYVAAERNYNGNSEIECDLVFWKDGENESWMEIKTSRYSELKDKRQLDKNSKNSWSNSPKEQFDSWKKDIEKLKKLNNNNTSKFFVLVEQCNDKSLFDKIITEKKYENYQLLQDLNQMSYEFELIWKKAPVNKCIVRIFGI
jgi:hypothetical protein